MTSTRAPRRMAAAILLTGTLLGAGWLHPAGASENRSSSPAASASNGGSRTEEGHETSKKGSFDLTKKGSFDITE